jgi:hypothetical protein
MEKCMNFGSENSEANSADVGEKIQLSHAVVSAHIVRADLDM